MQALGQLSPVLTVEAKIQERVAKFLAMKSVIAKLMKHSSLTISSRASGLLNIQYQLETELQQALAVVERMKKDGIPSFSNLAYLGNFAYSLESHIGAVQALEKNAALPGAGLVDEESIFAKPWFWPLAIGFGGAMIYVYYK